MQPTDNHVVTQSWDSEPHKRGTQGPESWRLSVPLPLPWHSCGFFTHSRHPRNICAPTPNLLVHGNTSYSCRLVSGRDPWGPMLVFWWQCWWALWWQGHTFKCLSRAGCKASLVQLPRASTGESCQRPTTALGGDREGLCRCPWTSLRTEEH